MKQYYGREIPVEDHYLELEIQKRNPQKPMNPIAALMEADFLSDPDMSAEDIDEIKEAVIDSIEELSEEDRFIVDAINYEHLTYVELGERMGISNAHAWRLKQAAYERLEEILLSKEVIKQKLGVV